jgi:hypothetical protein
MMRRMRITPTIQTIIMPTVVSEEGEVSVEVEKGAEGGVDMSRSQIERGITTIEGWRAGECGLISD